ncbi:MAG: arginine repressor [Planctomycetota bacterium]
MKEKIARQSKIARIIKDQPVATQEELLKCLKQKGVNVTQATLSRDIKDMSIIQVPGTNGRRYQLLSGSPAPVTQSELARRFGVYVINIKTAGNLIVVKTLPGEASGMAGLVDGLNLPEVLGTIAGDDTFLIIAKNKQSVNKILERIDHR